MKRYLISTLLVAILLGGGGLAYVASPSKAANSRPAALSQEPISWSDYVPGQILLKFRAGVVQAAAADVLDAHGLAVVGDVRGLGVLRVAVPEGQEAALVEALIKNPRVEYAEVDHLVYPSVIPNDSRYDEQWGPDKIQAPAAWDIETGSSDVVIAIVDTGVELDHPDLDDKIWTNPGEIPGNDVDDDGNGFVDDVHGWDFNAHDNDPQDWYGHGTHVAGTAAAETNNSRGVAGISWGARIMPVKVFNDRGGGGTYSIVAEGVLYACSNGAAVINMSLSGCSYSETLHEAMQQAYDSGCLMAAAAGNSDCGGYVEYPASDPLTVAVAATRESDSRASFSSTGPELNVAAPGVSIHSTYLEHEYEDMSGTSMAAPHVSGLAGLVWSVNPSLTNAEVQGIMESTAVDLGGPGKDSYYGFGRINAFDAVQAALPPGHTVSTPSTPAGPSCGQPGESLTYSTGGSIDSEGDAVEYRFDWGDGPYSDWSPSSTASHDWSSPGEYAVRAQARCVVETDIVSSWSVVTTVTITAPALTATPDSMMFLGDDDVLVPGEQVLLVGNDALCGELNWEAAADESWVLLGDSVGAASSSDPAEIAVTVDSWSLDYGTFEATVTISSTTQGVLETPQTVGVTFAYTDTLERAFVPLVVRD